MLLAHKDVRPNRVWRLPTRLSRFCFNIILNFGTKRNWCKSRNREQLGLDQGKATQFVTVVPIYLQASFNNIYKCLAHCTEISTCVYHSNCQIFASIVTIFTVCSSERTGNDNQLVDFMITYLMILLEQILLLLSFPPIKIYAFLFNDNVTRVDKERTGFHTNTEVRTKFAKKTRKF